MDASLENKENIIHISDLHCNGDVEWNKAFDFLKNDIENQKPKLILITGDLVNSPFLSKFKHLENKLSDLYKTCDLNPEEDVIMVPGNHDFRLRGVMPFFGSRKKIKELTNFSFEKAESILTKHKVAIFPFNSNSRRGFKMLATGKIDKSEINRFNNLVKTYKNYDEELYNKSLKIAILHHHPIPIAGSETNRIKDSDVFLLLQNAGTFMKEMSKIPVDLILHGHKHCPHVSRIKYDVADLKEAEITVLSAGSACSTNLDNSYNIIKLNDFPVIKIERRFSSKGGTFSESKKVELFSYKFVREKKYYNKLTEAEDSLKVKSICRQVKIDKFGDAIIKFSFGKVKLIEGANETDRVIFEALTNQGQIRKIHGHSDTHQLEFIDDEKRLENKRAGFFKVKPAITPFSEEFDYNVSYCLKNGYALDVEQSQEMYGSNTPEYTSFKICRQYDLLKLMIELEEYKTMQRLLLHIVSNLLKQNPSTQQEIKQILNGINEYLIKSKMVKQEEELDISLMVFRKKSEKNSIGQLEVTNCYHDSSPEFKLFSGAGVAGRAYKLKKIFFYKKGILEEDRDYYWSSGREHEILISFPIFYKDPKFVVAVLNIGSYSINPRLNKHIGENIFIDEKEILEDFCKYFIEEFNVLFNDLCSDS